MRPPSGTKTRHTLRRACCERRDTAFYRRLGILGSVLAGRLLLLHQQAAQGGEGAASSRREALSLVDPVQVRAARAWMCDAIAQAKRRIAWSGKRSRTSLLVVEVSMTLPGNTLGLCSHA